MFYEVPVTRKGRFLTLWMAESLENEALFLEGLAMVKFCSDVQA
jgi:hypothetical protein